MLEINNVLRPCILCYKPVRKESKSAFCDECSIFKNKNLLEQAIQNFEEEEDYEPENISLLDSTETIIGFTEEE